MSVSSSRRGRRGGGAHLHGDAPAASGQVESAASASLSELRRRAAHRLREIGASLEMVREQYEEAAAECARLHAGGEPAVTRVVAQPRPANRQDGAAAADDGEPEALRAQAEELRRRLDAAADLLAAEHARSQKLKGSLNEVERELAETRDALEAERARGDALRVEAENLRAEVRQLQGEAPRTSEDSAEGWRQRVLQLQIDLRRALADNGQLQDEMAGLVRFLDELSAVLSAPAAG